MITKSTHIRERSAVVKREVPSLVDLSVQNAIDNLSHIGDVGDIDFHLLERILPHCTLEQLRHVEDSTQERDLSQVTDKLWKKFYVAEFGTGHTSLVVKYMKKNKISTKWKLIYQAKQEQVKKEQQWLQDEFKKILEIEKARKQGLQGSFCTKVQPSSSKRSFYEGGGSGSSACNSKSSSRKKAKLDALKK